MPAWAHAIPEAARRLSRRLAEVMGGLREESVSVILSESDAKHSADRVDPVFNIERGVVAQAEAFFQSIYSMSSFIFETAPKITCGQGTASRLGEMVKNMGVRRLFLVTDAGVIKAGLIDGALASLSAAGVAVTVFSEVLADPPQEKILSAVAAAKHAQADGVVGFGGGSSLDTAKLVALLACTPQELSDIYGIGLARGPRLPLIQIPTTAGTGSEVTPISIVTTPSNEKKGVVSPLLYPDVALLVS